MESAISESAVSEDVYRAGYKMSWTYYGGPIITSLSIVLMSAMQGHITYEVLRGHADHMLADDAMRSVELLVLFSVMACLIVVGCVWRAKEDWDMFKYGSLLISPSGLVNQVGRYRSDNAKWSDVVFVAKDVGWHLNLGFRSADKAKPSDAASVSETGKYTIRIILRHGSVVIRSDMLFDAEQTIKLIREYAELEVEKRGLFAVTYRRKA